MRSTVTIMCWVLIALSPSGLCHSDLETDKVKEFIMSQPAIAIDMTRTRSQFKDNWELKRKNFKAGSRR